MPVNIHGKQYVTVAERVAQLHAGRNGNTVQITTTITEDTMEQVVVMATVRCEAGVFTGHAHSMKTRGGIEGDAPLEVAETSAVGRALGFAGFGSSKGIATADEVRAYDDPPYYGGDSAPPARRPSRPARKAPPKTPKPGSRPSVPASERLMKGDDAERAALFGLASEMWKGQDAHDAICAALMLPGDGEGAITEHWIGKGGTYKQAQTYLAEVRRIELGGKPFEDACKTVNAYAQLTANES